MLAISSGNALVMHTYTLFTPFQFFFILCECLKLYFNKNKENEIVAKNVRALLCPILTGLPANSVTSPWDWIIIMYFNARSTQGVIFFNDRCISSCWTLSYLANEVILMVCNER